MFIDFKTNIFEKVHRFRKKSYILHEFETMFERKNGNKKRKWEIKRKREKRKHKRNEKEQT